MLSQKTVDAIYALQKRYPEKRSALIPALHIAQDEAGYLPHEVQEEVAKLFGLDTTEVHAIVTFYDMFFEEPVGDTIIHVCKNASCMLRGCDEMLQKLCHKLNIKPGETTSDGKYTIIASECLGACDRAPMMLVGETVVGPVTDIDRVLENG